MSKAAANIIASSSPLPADNSNPIIKKIPLLAFVATSTEKIEKENKDIQDRMKQEKDQLPQQGYIKYPTYDFF